MENKTAIRDTSHSRSPGIDRTLIARLLARLTKRTSCPDEAADILQDSFLRFTRRASTEIVNSEGYLWRIACNVAVDRHRRANVAPCVPLDEDLPSSAPAPDRILVGQNTLREVMRAADQLPLRCREVFVLRKIEGWEQQEIAAHLGISLNMVQKHLRKALADITSALGGDI